MRAILTTFVPEPEESTQESALVAAPEAPARRPQSLEDLAAACVRDAFGDPATASQLLQERIQGNRKAFKELTQPLLAGACLQAVSARIRANRPPEDDWNKDEYEEPDTSGRLHALAESLLDFRLPNGTILRDAFVHDVREGAAVYRKRANKANKRASWLEAIAARMQRHRTVSEILDEATIFRMFEDSPEAS